jgi:hypothetical protein
VHVVLYRGLGLVRIQGLVEAKVELVLFRTSVSTLLRQLTSALTAAIDTINHPMKFQRRKQLSSQKLPKALRRCRSQSSGEADALAAMDTSYLTTQVTTIISQLHGIFDEIGIPRNEREAKETEVLFFPSS